MKINQIRERAKQMGVAQSAKLKKGEAIRAIQRAEGNQDCFGADWRFDCQQHYCCWRDDCLTAKPG